MSRNFYKEDNEEIPAIVYELLKPNNFTQITDLNELKNLYIGLYKQREIDGINYFEEFRAGLMMDVISGNYTGSEVFELENHINNLQYELIKGNWLTGQITISNLSLLGIFTQVMKDEIKLKIDSYVSENY